MSQDEFPLEVDCLSVHRDMANDPDMLLLDCREQDEYNTARIAGSQLLPMSELSARVGELAPHRDRRVVVHCHHGGRSLRVARWLRQQGFARAQSMAGGIDRWSCEIDPAVPRYG